MANHTCIDEVVDKVFQLIEGRFAHKFPDVQVLDGPSVDDVGQDIIAVGIAVDDTSLDSNIVTAGLETDREMFDLICMVRSWNGDDDLPARRTRAFTLFRDVADMIKENPRLDRTVARARVATISYSPTRLPEGAIATINFKIRIDAFTS